MIDGYTVGMSQWMRFFDAHAPHYDENPFAQHTKVEVEFLLKLYPLAAGSRILDVGCGTGRHAIEFAQRGFRVTGVDFSEGMLAQARAKALVAGVEVDWVRRDARELTFDAEFDAAICLCEGGVGLIERGEDAETHDMAIFRGVARALKPNASFVMTALNGYRSIRQFTDQHIADGVFDPMSMVSMYADEWNLPEGTQNVNITERLFIAPEIVRMLREVGFTVDNVYGGTAGHWGQRFLNLDEIEAMFIARRATS